MVFCESVSACLFFVHFLLCSCLSYGPSCLIQINESINQSINQSKALISVGQNVTDYWLNEWMNEYIVGWLQDSRNITDVLCTRISYIVLMCYKPVTDVSLQDARHFTSIALSECITIFRKGLPYVAAMTGSLAEATTREQ